MRSFLPIRWKNIGLLCLATRTKLNRFRFGLLKNKFFGNMQYKDKCTTNIVLSQSSNETGSVAQQRNIYLSH